MVSITMAVGSKGAVITREKDESVGTGERLGVESVDALLDGGELLQMAIVAGC